MVQGAIVDKVYNHYFLSSLSTSDKKDYIL